MSNLLLKVKGSINALLIWLSIIATCPLLLCCDQIRQDQEMHFVKYTLKKTTLSGNQIKTNGYFYREEKRANPRFFVYYRFYKEGTFNYYFYIRNLEVCDNLYLNWPFSRKGNEYKFYTGIFMVINETLWTEIHERCYTGAIQPTYFSCGKILNDTTIRLTKYYLSNGKDSVTIDDTLHFRSIDDIRADSDVLVN